MSFQFSGGMENTEGKRNDRKIKNCLCKDETKCQEYNFEQFGEYFIQFSAKVKSSLCRLISGPKKSSVFQTPANGHFPRG